DLRRAPSVVVPGEYQPARVHLLAHAINEQLGNVGKTVVHTDPVEALPVNQLASLTELTEDMAAGRVELLVIVGGNPALDAPGFAAGLDRVAFKAHLGLYQNETSRLCDWHIPEAHELEAWSDARAFDGTASIVQPLIAPLYDGRSAHELVAALAGRADQSGYNLVRDYWKGRSYFLSYRAGNRSPSEEDFEELWERSLHDGVIEGTSADPVSIPVAADIGERAGGAGAGLDLVVRPDPTTWDGRFANNHWLQELPKPITKLTWDHAAQLSPVTAGRLGIETGDVVELAHEDQKIEAPALIVPG
ncbi:MAG: molybdopterin oxidoreductase, partial [bacterium]|nr:molybdopterin oxidoreductase [bacterium]